MTTVAAIVLGLTFLISGALKARDPGWPAAAAALGAPEFTVRLVAPVELILGSLLIVGLAVKPMALLALGLLHIFTAMLVAAIRRGHAPVCACFGALSARPIGPKSVARNLMLMIVAVFVAI